MVYPFRVPFHSVECPQNKSVPFICYQLQTAVPKSLFLAYIVTNKYQRKHNLWIQWMIQSTDMRHKLYINISMQKTGFLYYSVQNM